MLQSHNANYFKFDGKMDKRWLIVNTSNDTSFNFGRSKTVNTESGAFQPTYTGITSSLPSLTLEVFRVDYKGEPCKMTTQDMFELNKWLDRKEPKALEMNGFIYYGIFSPQSGKWFPNNFGLFELKFDMIVPYMYGAMVNNKFIITTSKIVEIENKSNVDEEVYADIRIKVLSGNTVTIKNLVSGKITTLNNLTVYNIYEIYNQEKQMVNLTNARENVYTNSNKVYQELVYGVNRFEITTNGKVEVNIMYQPKICLQ